MALLPTRVLAPKDKAAVEGSVGQLTTRIIGKLRNSQFFSIYEVNAAVWKLLKDFNAAPFQKSCPFCRHCHVSLMNMQNGGNPRSR